MPRKPRPHPTQREDYGAGAIAAANNAKRHVRIAEAAAGISEWGPAVSHLVLAIEETIKADVLIDRYYLGDHSWYSDSAFAQILSHHEVRHTLARARSFAPSELADLLDDLLTDPGVDRQTFQAALAAASERREAVLPDDWEACAKALREGGFYVTFDGQNWTQPGDITEGDFRTLLPRVQTLLDQTYGQLALARQMERLATRQGT